MAQYFSTEGDHHLTPTQIKNLNNLIWELFVRWNLHFTNAGNPVNKIIEDDHHRFVYLDPTWIPVQPIQPVAPQNPLVPAPLAPQPQTPNPPQLQQPTPAPQRGSP